MIKSRKMRMMGHVVCMGENRDAYRFYRENSKERAHLEDLAIDGRILLKWLIKKDGKMSTVLIWLSTGTSCRIL
jgi:hypothetical protein